MSCSSSSRRRWASVGEILVGGLVPQQPVVYEHQAGAELECPLEQLAVRRDPGGHRLHLVATGHLQAVGPVVLEALGLQEGVEVLEDGLDRGHGRVGGR